MRIYFLFLGDVVWYKINAMCSAVCSTFPRNFIIESSKIKYEKSIILVASRRIETKYTVRLSIREGRLLFFFLLS